MLRNLVLALAVLVTLTGVLALAAVGAGAGGWIAFGALLLVGTVFERARYKRLQPSAPGAGFVRTAERFKDDATGAPVTVYADPATGERAYVRE